MIVYKQTQFNSFMYTIDGINPKTLTAKLSYRRLNETT